MNKPEPSLYYDWFKIREYFESIGQTLELKNLPYMYEINNGELFYLDEEMLDDCQQEGYVKLNNSLRKIIKEFGNIEMKVWW